MKKLFAVIIILSFVFSINNIKVKAADYTSFNFDDYQIGDTITYIDENWIEQIFIIDEIVIPFEEYKVSPLSSTYDYTEDDRYWLAATNYFEAGDQGYDGQILISDCIVNRVNDTRWPSTIKSVVLQPYQFYHPYDIKPDDIPQSCWDAADYVLQHGSTDERILFFNSTEWTEGATPLYKFGDHYFSTN